MATPLRTPLPKPSLRTKKYCSFINFGLHHYQPKSNSQPLHSAHPFHCTYVMYVVCCDCYCFYVLFHLHFICYSAIRLFASLLLTVFLNDNNLSRCDVLFPVSTKFTYVSESLNCASLIDYMVTSSTESTVAFNILDLDVNLSDHLPLMAVCLCEVPTTHIKTKCECSTDVAHF